VALPSSLSSPIQTHEGRSQSRRTHPVRATHACMHAHAGEAQSVSQSHMPHAQSRHQGTRASSCLCCSRSLERGSPSPSGGCPLLSAEDESCRENGQPRREVRGGGAERRQRAADHYGRSKPDPSRTPTLGRLGQLTPSATTKALPLSASCSCCSCCWPPAAPRPWHLLPGGYAAAP